MIKTVLLLLSTLFSSITAQTGNRCIVVCKENVEVDTVIGQLNTNFQLNNVRTYPNVGMFAMDASSEILVHLDNNPNIQTYAEDSEVNVNSGLRKLNQQTNPDWGLDRIDQEDLPLDNIFRYPRQLPNRKKVYIYVLDTGIYINHVNFQGRARWGKTFTGESNNDQNGHGTHVAGTAIAAIYGVARWSNAVAVKVLSNSGIGSWEWVIAGLDYVIESSNSLGVDIPIVSMSLGGNRNEPVNIAIERLYNLGILSVVAAGNEARDACLTSPASAENAITVGSIGETDSRSDFSNYGSCVDLFAPGESITSLAHYANGYRVLSGTSMATPFVSGVLAHLYENSINCDFGEENGAIKAERMTNHLLEFTTQGVLDDIKNGSPNRLLFLSENLNTFDCLAGVSPTPTVSVTPSPSSIPQITPSVSPTPRPRPSCSILEIEIVPDEYPEDIRWLLFYLQDNTIIESGKVSKYIELCSPGQYSFIIHDIKGNGICCGFGNGYYNLYLNEELIYQGDGRFGENESWTFSVLGGEENLVLEGVRDGLQYRLNLDIREL